MDADGADERGDGVAFDAGEHGDGAAFDAEQLGPGGKLGSFSVRVEPEEHLVSVCLEEATGRVCLLLNNITTGARRISVIDVV